MSIKNALYKKIKLFVPGGRLAIDDFTHLLELCKLIGVNHFQFGRRQEIIIRLPKERLPNFERSLKGFMYEVEGENGYSHHNVISSFLTHEICPSTYWLRGSTILEILDSIDWLPTIRVSITDLKQDMVYSFTGDINFIPSDQENFWHVYLRNRAGGNLWYFPFIVHSDDIHRVVSVYEQEHKNEEETIESKIETLHSQLQGRLTATTYEPQINVAEFFNYEGIYNYGEDKYWLGIYKRETRFQFSELESIVSLCKQHMIGYMHITPWKSLVVKDILSENIVDWKLLLAQNGLSIGHSHAELNWQINDFDEDAYDLKAYLRKEIAANDVANTGVIIGINNDKNYSFSHIIIEKTPFLKLFGTNEVSTYTIYNRKDFNPTYNEFEVHKKWVTKSGLLNALKSAFECYYEKAYKEPSTFTAKPLQIEKDKVLKDKVVNETVHQCDCCGTVYFSEIGDMDRDIIPGTSFKLLPETYTCSLCDAPKQSFKPIDKKKIEVIPM